MATYGYCRISTDKQETERQVLEITEYCNNNGLGSLEIFKEVTGGTKKKPILESILNSLHENDILLVWELSRLTRGGVASLFAIAERVRNSGAKLIETKSNTTLDNTPAGASYIFALGLASQIERDLISQRTKSALKERKLKGMKLGRPTGKSKLDERRQEIEGYQSLELSKSHISRLLKVSRTTYLNWLKKENK